MPEHIHLGHSLTRHQAAHRAGIPPEEFALRPDLLRIRGRWLGEVYYEFQFGSNGIREDLADVVRTLHARFDDLTIADWLARPNPQLDGRTPVSWATGGGDRRRLMSAVTVSGPTAPREEGTKSKPSATPPQPPAATRRRRRLKPLIPAAGRTRPTPAA